MSGSASSSAALRPDSTEISAIVEAAGTMIVATDLNGIIWLFNPAAERMLGWTADEVIGKKTPALWHVCDEIVSRAAELSQKLGREIEPGPEYFQTLHEIGDRPAKCLDDCSKRWNKIQGSASHFSLVRP